MSQHKYVGLVIIAFTKLLADQLFTEMFVCNARGASLLQRTIAAAAARHAKAFAPVCMAMILLASDAGLLRVPAASDAEPQIPHTLLLPAAGPSSQCCHRSIFEGI
jgi:hypothetical protein